LEKIIIAAVSSNGVIGNEGKIPWSCKAELQHFKMTTVGFPVIMGSRTWEAIGSPLKNRINIVLSKSGKAKATESIVVFDSLITALQFCEEQNYSKCFIIGGAQVYASALGLSDKMIITKMKFEVEGDVSFPKFNENEWIETQLDDFREFAIHTYIRNEKIKSK